MPGHERPDHELSALAALAGEELGRAVGGIAATHEAIADRAFAANGPAAAPARATHDAIAALAYGSVRLGSAAFGLLAAEVVRSGVAAEEQTVSHRPRGANALAVLSGLFGDALSESRSPLAPAMSIRLDGRIIHPDAEALRAAFPGAGGSLCVFLHGLMESEFAWGIASEGPQTYGSALAGELGCSPLYVRYNTGLHISTNGRDLSELLCAVSDAWPVPVTDIALIGHSMGGLVARSACHHGDARGERWVSLVRHTVSLGTPHHGAPLPRAVHVADAALHGVPETRALGALLRRRSAGIRDLRHGSLVDEDWQGRDPDVLRAAAVAEVPLLAGATHAFVSATVTRSPVHPLGRLLGDTLVLPASAEGRERRQQLVFAHSHALRLGGTHHLALLRHPRVRAQLCAWLGAGRTRPVIPSA